MADLNRWTKAEAVAKCGITQVRVNDLLRGRISRFSLDDLATLRQL
ncbi:MAG: helix-turn-helix domain-containing protein [Cyanobacteria bacterium]|nr:helix-turn-helix domain-containing protein [Cyanobacteriota bacterium]